MRPDRTEAADYYFRYIDQVPGTDIRGVLDTQRGETITLLRGIPEEKSLHRYAPEKWSIREVMGHVNDTERLFAFRALWFARNCEGALPSFDQDPAVAAAASDRVSWKGLVEEFAAVRAATITLFENLPVDAWSRRGVASGYEFSVRALAFISAGHVAHHLRILRERYL